MSGTGLGLWRGGCDESHAVGQLYKDLQRVVLYTVYLLAYVSKTIVYTDALVGTQDGIVSGGLGIVVVQEDEGCEYVVVLLVVD